MLGEPCGDKHWSKDKMRKLLLLVVILGFARLAGAETVWIDTDVSIGSPIREVDDAYALVLALRSPEIGSPE